MARPFVPAYREEPFSPPVPWHQVALFAGLAYVLSWLWWAPLVWPYLSWSSLTEPLPNALADAGAGRAALGMFGPAIAAVIMRRVGGEPLRGSLGAKRPWRYYVIAVAAPALFVTSVVCIDVAAGLGRFEWPQFPVLTFATVLFVGGAVTLPLTIGEEYGWFVASVALTAFPFTWLYVASDGSVLVAAVMHSVLNALSDSLTSARYIPDGNPLVVGGGGLVGAGVLLGIASVAASLRSRRAIVADDQACHGAAEISLDSVHPDAGDRASAV